MVCFHLTRYGCDSSLMLAQVAVPAHRLGIAIPEPNCLGTARIRSWIGATRPWLVLSPAGDLDANLVNHA